MKEKKSGFIIYLNDNTTKIVEYDYNLVQLDYITMKYSFNYIKRTISRDSGVDLRDFNKINIISDGIVYSFQNNNEYLMDCLKVNDKNKFKYIRFNGKIPGKNNGNFKGPTVSSSNNSFIEFSSFLSNLIYYKKDEDLNFFDCMYQDDKNNMEYNRNVSDNKDKKKISKFYLKILSNINLGQTPDGMQELNNYLSNYNVFRSFAVRYKDAFQNKNRYIEYNKNSFELYEEINKEKDLYDSEYVNVNDYVELKDYDEDLTVKEVDEMYGRNK